MNTINIFQEKITQQGHCSNINKYDLLIDSFILFKFDMYEKSLLIINYFIVWYYVFCVWLCQRFLFCFCFSKPLMNNWDNFFNIWSSNFWWMKNILFYFKSFSSELTFERSIESTSSSIEWIVCLRYKYCSIFTKFLKIRYLNNH